MKINPPSKPTPLNILERKEKKYIDILDCYPLFQGLNHETMLTAANGEKFPAKKVFSYSLQFFREHALRELSDQSGVKIMSDDVKWVITVPAIWKQPAKQFMREAAYEVQKLLLSLAIDILPYFL